MKVWLDGSVHEADLARISVRDHGLTVGDGVFETMKVVDGVPFALGRHLARLHGSAGRLGLVAPPAAELRAAAAQLIAAHAPGEVGRLRITLTGGDGPPGTERGDGGPTVLMVTGPARCQWDFASPGRLFSHNTCLGRDLAGWGIYGDLPLGGDHSGA